MRNIRYIFLYCLLAASAVFAQGVVNDGANIVVSENANIYIVGNDGNYTNQNFGKLTSVAGGGTIKLNGDWFNNATNEAFVNDGITVNFDNNTNQTIGGSNTTAFYTITLTGLNSKLFLDVNTKAGGISNTIGNINLNNRIIDLNTHKLEVTNPSTYAFTRGSGYIISETAVANNTSIIQWNTGTEGVYEFPFGVSGDYIPIIINKKTEGASDISVSTRATARANNAPWTSGVTSMYAIAGGLNNAAVVSVIDRWYEINPSTDITADLTLSYRGVENTTTINPTGAFAMQHYNNGTWEDQQGEGPGITEIGVESVTASNVTEFSTFVLTSKIHGELPVVLVDYNAYCDNGKTIIEWTSASEINAEKYVIKRSSDALNWEVLGEVPAARNSNQILNYSLTDDNPLNGTNYYILEQHDFNGDFEIYDILSANCFSSYYDNTITLYPNPTKEGFQLNIQNNSSAENANIQLYDFIGNIIKGREVVINSGTNTFHFDTSNLNPGTYILRVVSNHKYKPIKVVVL